MLLRQEKSISNIMLPGRIRVKRESVFECDLNLFESEHIIKTPITLQIGISILSIQIVLNTVILGALLEV